MSIMDESDLIREYTEKAKEWIFQKSLKFYVEDDEILDLDSLSLDSNEDTWLYSSDEKPHSSIDESDLNASRFAPSNFAGEAMNPNLDYTHDLSSFSPLIDVNNCSDSLIHVPDISPATIENYLALTPMEERKSKSNLRTALSNQFHFNRINDRTTKDETDLSFVKSKTETEFKTFQKDGASESNTLAFKRLHANNNDSIDKSYVLHSVENKLFTITDADTNDGSNFHPKISQNRIDYVKLADNQTTNDQNNTKNSLSDQTKSNSTGYKSAENNPSKESEKKWSNKTFRAVPARNAVSNVCENDENDHRSASKKYVPFCQSTPMLLNRFLKYNKTIDDSKNFSKWRTSAEFLKEDIDEIESDLGKNEMNVSYIKHPTGNGQNFSHAKDCVSPPEDSGSESCTNLNTTYSKSECFLNSTYEIPDEDGTSSASEGSASSLNNERSFSIRDVQKMAEMQERRLQKQIHPNYCAGSSKSSEISSSNESISPFSPLSSSNEGQIDAKSNHINRNSSATNYQDRRPFTADTMVYSSRTTNVRTVRPTTTQSTIPADEKCTTNSLKKPANNNIAFKCKSPTANGDVLSSPQSIRNIPKLNKNEQNMRNISFNNRLSSAEVASVDNTAKLKQRKLSSDNKVDVQNTTFISKLCAPKTVQEHDSTFIKESKAREDQVRMMHHPRSASPAPVSHIPRPSSRIPKLRTSTSCTRYSKNSYDTSKK